MIGMRKFVRATAVLLPVLASVGAYPATADDHPPGTASPVSAVATVETPPAFDDEAGGDADSDDPEVWLHPDDSDDSLVLGTEKQNGLKVFDLRGRVVQHLPAPPPPGPGDANGRLNNVDVLYDVEIGGVDRDIAVVTDRGLDKLHVYSIDPDAAEDRDAPLTEITDPAAPFLFAADQAEVNEQNTAYGIAAWQAADGGVHVLVTREHRTEIALVRLVAKPGGRIGYQQVREVALPARFALPDGTTWAPCDEPGREPQSEGMVVDVERNVAYVSQEGVGIWRVEADLHPFRPHLVDRVREFGVPGTYDPETEECVAGPDPGFGGRNLSADAEGLTLYHREDGAGYLIASSQGDSTYAVYDRVPGNRYTGSFRIADGRGVDSTENTDSLFVTNVPVGPFRRGLLLVQDGENTPEVPGPGDEPRENTNFKFVPWENVANAFPDRLEVDTDGHDPRDD